MARRSLFRGRDDVYTVRWTNQHGESGYVPAVAGGWRKKRPRGKQRYRPLTDDVIRTHLAGEKTIGFVSTARRRSLLVARGGLRRADLAPWMFFSERVTAIDARRLGTGLLGVAIDARAELTLDSYDRLFRARISHLAGASRCTTTSTLPCPR